MSGAYPKYFSLFYDFMYSKLRDSKDSEYFLNEILSTKGKVLEIGTGTGRLFLQAIDKHADIYGIDISEDMLNVLLNKLDKSFHSKISRQDFKDFSFLHKFDLIIAPFRVFMHLTEVNDQFASLNNAYAHLNEGGKFIFDTFIPDLNQLINGLDNVEDLNEEYDQGRRLRRLVSTTPDYIKQLLNVNFTLIWDEKDGEKSESWDMKIRYFFRYELEHLISRSNFENFEIKGGFSGEELTNDSKEFVVTCYKSA